MEVRHVAWPSIESFAHVKRSAEWRKDVDGPVCYKAKVKLHGMNAGIQIVDGDVYAQSRKQILTDESSGLAGFRDFVRLTRSRWLEVGNAVVFGEWAGRGIQKGVAASHIDRKIFAVFAILLDDRLVIDPDDITTMIGTTMDKDFTDHVYVLPWYSNDDVSIEIDWRSSKEVLEDVVDRINVVTLDVAREDPWIFTTFNVQGKGEGLVWYPIGFSTKDGIGNYLFKTKSEEFSVVKEKTPASVSPETIAGVETFVRVFATEQRLEQIASEFSLNDLRDMGNFLKNFAHDVQKESRPELQDANLSWYVPFMLSLCFSSQETSQESCDDHGKAMVPGQSQAKQGPSRRQSPSSLLISSPLLDAFFPLYAYDPTLFRTPSLTKK